MNQKELFFKKICNSVSSSDVNKFVDGNYRYGQYPSLREVFGVYRKDTISKERLEVIENGHLDMFMEDNILNLNINELDVLDYKPKNYNIIDWLEECMFEFNINQIFNGNEDGLTLTKLDGQRVLHYWWDKNDYINRDKVGFKPNYVNRKSSLDSFM